MHSNQKTKNETIEIIICSSGSTKCCSLLWYTNPFERKMGKDKKSISIDLLMDATIEEGSKELILNFHEDIGFVYVMITDPMGGETYNEKINTDEISILVIPLSKQENGILSITDGQNHLYGEFINN